MSGYVSQSRDNSFRVNKGVMLPDINNFGHSPSKTPLPFCAKQQIQALQKDGSYESQVILNKDSQLELLL